MSPTTLPASKTVVVGLVALVAAAGCARRPPAIHELAVATRRAAPLVAVAGDVYTGRNSVRRDGLNPVESVLSAGAFPDSFGLRCRWSDSGPPLHTPLFDEKIYTQPLYVSNVTLEDRGSPGAPTVTTDIVFVATANNTVYALDAKSCGHVLQSRHLGAVRVSSFPNWFEGGFIMRQQGVTGTPVIDPATGTLFVVSKRCVSDCTSKTRAVGKHYLYALDIAAIADVTRDKVATDGDGVLISDGGGDFDLYPSGHLNRAALLLDRASLYVAFGGSGTDNPVDANNPKGIYHGWVFEYDESLERKAVFNTTPGYVNGSATTPGAGAVWMAGSGLASDGVSVYAVTGNGPTSAVWHSDEVLELGASGLALVSSAPADRRAWLALQDLDLGSGGPLLVPWSDGTRVVVGGKDGQLYVHASGGLARSQRVRAGFNQYVDTVVPAGEMPGRRQRACVGAECTTSSDPVHDTYPHIHGAPAYWRSSDAYGRVYVWAEKDYLRAFWWDPAAGTFASGANTANDEDCAAVGVDCDANRLYRGPNGMPGAMLSVSADGLTEGSGIVWASIPTREDSVYNPPNVAGSLMAFDAITLERLWSSDDDPADAVGMYAKYVPPTVSHGNVFLVGWGTRTGKMTSGDPIYVPESTVLMYGP